jgi:hypothetical protein
MRKTDFLQGHSRDRYMGGTKEKNIALLVYTYYWRKGNQFNVNVSTMRFKRYALVK